MSTGNFNNTVINKQDVKTIAEQNAAGVLPVLGYCVYWGTKEFLIRKEIFHSILGNVGLPVDLLSRNQARGVVTKAINKVKRSVKGSVAKQFHGENSKMVGVIAGSTFDEQSQDAQFQTDTKVIFDKDTEKLEAVGNKKEDIEKYYEEYKACYSNDQVRTYILDCVLSVGQGFSLKENGGVYFLRSDKAEVVQKLTQLAEELTKVSSFCEFFSLPLVDGSQSRQSLWVSFMRDLNTEYENLVKELNTPVKQQRAFTNRVDQTKEFFNKLETYELMFQYKIPDVKDKTEKALKGFVQGYINSVSSGLENV